jgi:enoyl-CoA hydratase
VSAVEALGIGLVERLAQPGDALEEARELARRLAAFPQGALRSDRRSLLGQWSLGFADALRAEYLGGVEVLDSGEAREGARRFTGGGGRHGE